MTGRGIDQILPHPSDPILYESYVRDARRYVQLAEMASGPIPKPVDYTYLWGDCLAEWERVAPDLRIINLETSITTSAKPWPGKGIHYRMHPGNISCITAAKIDCCSLANNHVLDWGYDGLAETLHTLHTAGVRTSGAGASAAEAEAAAILDVPDKGRVLLWSFGSGTSGIPPSWAATEDRPGVYRLDEGSASDLRRIQQAVARERRDRDIVVASVHWGPNWGYEISQSQQQFAHGLIDEAGVDVVFGHSSHHVKAIQVYRSKLILYGAGDFLDDYEGISGYDSFRDDLGLLYFASLDPTTGNLDRLQMTPTQVHRMQVRRAASADAQWLRDVLDRESEPFGARVEMVKDGDLMLRWRS